MTRRVIGVLAMLLAIGSGVRGHGATPRIEIFSAGLDNPRGLAFGPDGKLYVAEAGSGGTRSGAAVCLGLQIAPPYGPYTNGPTARISRLDRFGQRRTLLDRLPSGQSQIPDWQGVADVTFMGDRLFALVQGGGCSYGSPSFPKSVIEVDTRTGKWRHLADLGAFRRTHPSGVKDDDLEPEGVYYSIEAAFGRLYVIDANSGQLLEVTLDGRIRTVVDFAAKFGHVTPTALAQFGPWLVVGNLFKFPIEDGKSNLFIASPFGFAAPFAGGLTAVIDIAFDRRGRLYALEMGNGKGSGFPDPEAGRVVRVNPWGTLDVVVSGLTFPTGMTFGRDGRLYISNRGFDTPPAGTGEIVVVDLDGDRGRDHGGDHDGDHGGR